MVYNSGGGGIWSFGSLTVNNSTISGNRAGPSGAGGGIAGDVTLVNSTVLGNLAETGGGISGNVTIANREEAVFTSIVVRLAPETRSLLEIRPHPAQTCTAILAPRGII